MDSIKKTLYRISELEIKLSGISFPPERSAIKKELTQLYREINRAKKRGQPTPKKPNFKRGL